MTDNMASNQDCEEKFHQLQEYVPFIECTIAKHEQISRNQVENNQLQRLQGLHKFLKQPSKQLLKMEVLEKVEAVIRNIYAQQMSANQRRQSGQDWDPRRDLRHEREDRPREREHEPRYNQDLEAERRAQDWESVDNERIREGKDKGRDKSFDRGSTDRERNFDRSSSKEYSRSSSREFEKGSSSKERDYDGANNSRERDYDRSSTSRESDQRGTSSRDINSNQRTLSETDVFRERRQRSLLDLPMPPTTPEPDMPHPPSGSWRHQSRYDNRQESRSDRDWDSRYNQRPDTRNEPRYEDSRSDVRQVQKQDHRLEQRHDPRQVSRTDTRQEYRTDVKGDHRHEPRPERRYDKRQESRPRTELTIPLECLSRENSSDRSGTHSERTKTSLKEDIRNRESISNRISLSSSGVERGDPRHSRPPGDEKESRDDVSNRGDKIPWDNSSPSHSSSSHSSSSHHWRMGKQQQQQQQLLLPPFPQPPQIKPPSISSHHSQDPPPDTPESPDMSPSQDFGINDTPQSPEASFSPTPPVDGETLSKVKTIPLDSLKQGVDLSLVKKALASLKTSDKGASQRPGSAQSYRYEDFVGPATTTKNKEDEPYDPEEVWNTQPEDIPKKSPKVDVDHRKIMLGYSNQKQLPQQTSDKHSTDMKMAKVKDKLNDIPLPPTSATLSQKSPYPREISKSLESNHLKSSLESNKPSTSDIPLPPTSSIISKKLYSRDFSKPLESIVLKSSLESILHPTSTNRPPSTSSTLLQKNPYPREFSKPSVSNVSKSSVGLSSLDKSNRGPNNEYVGGNSTQLVSGLQSRISSPVPTSPVGLTSQHSQHSKHGSQLNLTPTAKSYDSPIIASRSGTSGLVRSRDPRTKDDCGDVDLRSPKIMPNLKSPLSQSSPGMGTEKVEGTVERDSASRIDNIRARIEQGSSEFIKPGQKGVAVSQLEKYKQRRERQLSGSSEIKSPVSDSNKTKMVSVMDSILPNESEDDLNPEPMQLEEDSSPPPILSRDPRMNKPESSSDSVGSLVLSRDPRMSSVVSSQPIIATSRDPRSSRDPRKDLANRDPRHGILSRDPRQELINRDSRLEISKRDPRNNTSHRDPRQDQSFSRDLRPEAFSQRDPRQDAMSNRDPRHGNFNNKDPRSDSSMRGSNIPIGQPGLSSIQGTQIRDPRFGNNFERSPTSREMWQQPNSSVGSTGPPLGMGRPQVNLNVSPSGVGMPPTGMGGGYPSHRVSVPPPSSPHPPLYPMGTVADSVLSAGGSASLISDTYTCLMMEGLPYYANSSYVYHFFEEYLIRDIVIELDYKYQCKGISYVHFPSHSSAKEAFHKLNGWMMNGCPISLKHITVGFVRQAKNAYEVKNREREARLGLPEKPRGNGNPFYKPRPPKPPSPPPPPIHSTKTIQETSDVMKDSEVENNVEVDDAPKAHHSDLCGVKVSAKNSTVLKSFKIPKKKKIEPPKEPPTKETTFSKEQPNKIETQKEIKPIKHSKSSSNSKQNTVKSSKDTKPPINKADKSEKSLKEDFEDESGSESSTDSLDVPIVPNKTATKKKRFSKRVIETDSSNSDEDYKSSSKDDSIVIDKSDDKVFSTADSDNSGDDLVIDSDNSNSEDEESETSSQVSEDPYEKPKPKLKNLSPKISQPKRKQVSKKITPTKKTSPKIVRSKSPKKSPKKRKIRRIKKMDPLDGSKITRRNQIEFEKVVILKKKLKVICPIPQQIMVSLFLNEKKNTRGGRRRTGDIEIKVEEEDPALKELSKSIQIDTAPEESSSDKFIEKRLEDVKDVITFGLKKNKIKSKVNLGIDNVPFIKEIKSKVDLDMDNVPFITENFLKKEWAKTVRPGYTNRGKKRKISTNDNNRNKKARISVKSFQSGVFKVIKVEKDSHKEIINSESISMDVRQKNKKNSIDDKKKIKMNEEKQSSTKYDEIEKRESDIDEEIESQLDAVDSNSDSDEDAVFGVPQNIAQKLQTKRSLEEGSDSPDLDSSMEIDGSKFSEHKKAKSGGVFDTAVISNTDNISEAKTSKAKDPPLIEATSFSPFSASDVTDDFPVLSNSVMDAWLNDVDPRIVNELPDACEIDRVLNEDDIDSIDDHWPSKVPGSHDKTPITIETTADNRSTVEKSQSKSTYNSQLDLSKRNNKNEDVSGFAFKLQMCETGKGHDAFKLQMCDTGKGHDNSLNVTYNSLLDVSEKVNKPSNVADTQITPLKLNFNESEETDSKLISNSEAISNKCEKSKFEKTGEKKAKKLKVQKKGKLKGKGDNKYKNSQDNSKKEVLSKVQIDIKNTIDSVIAKSMSTSESVEAANNEKKAEMEILPSLYPSENVKPVKNKVTEQSNAPSSTNKDILEPLKKSIDKKKIRSRTNTGSSIGDSTAISLDNKTEDEMDDCDDTGSIIGSVCSFTDDAASIMSGEGRELKTPDSTSSKKSRKSRNTPMPPQGWRRVTRGAKVETRDVEVTDWDDGGIVDLFQCDLCQYVGRHRVSHLVNFHAEREVPCEFKKEDFGPVLRDHLGPPSIPEDPDIIDLSWIPDKMTFEDNIRCKEDDCEYTSISRFDMIYHYLDHYPKASHLIFHCRLCNYMSDNMEMFYDHVTSHTGEYRHSCDRCGHKSYKLSSIHEHHKETHRKMSKSITSKMIILEDGWPYIYACKHCTFVRIQASETETHIQQRHHGKAEMHRSNMTRCIVSHVERFGLLSNEEDAPKPKYKGKKRKKGQKEPDFKVFVGEELEDDSGEKVQELIDRISNNAYTPLSSIETHKRMSLLNSIYEKLNKESDIEEANETDNSEVVNNGIKTPVKAVRERIGSQDGLSPRQSPRQVPKISEKMDLLVEGDLKELEKESLDKMSEEENEDSSKELPNIEERETDEEESDDEELDKDELMEILKDSSVGGPLSNIFGNTIQKLTANLIQREEDREKQQREQEMVAASTLSSQNDYQDTDSDSDNLVICEDDEDSVRTSNTATMFSSSTSKGPRIRILSAGEINKGTSTSMGGRMFKCGAEKCNHSSADNKDLITHIISEHGAFKCIAQGCCYIGTTRPHFQSHMYSVHNNPKLSLLVCPFQCIVPLQTIEQLGAHLAKHALYPNMHESPFAEQSPPQTFLTSPMKSPAAATDNDDDDDDDDEVGGQSMFKIVGVSTLAPTVASQLFGDAEAMKAKVTSPMIGAISPPLELRKPVPAVVTLDDNDDDITEEPVATKQAVTGGPAAGFGVGAGSLGVVPGMSSLPNEPPTVPIENVFVRYQTPYTFKILTTKLAPEIFKCMSKQCVYAHDNQSDFLIHLKKHTEEKEEDFRCCYCLIALASPNDLVQHVITEHSHCQFQCKYCLYRALSTIYMGVHLKNFHPRDEPRYIKVQTINESAPINPSIDSFVRPYKCSFVDCQYKTVDAEAFKSHVSELHGQFAVIACGYCHVHLNVQSLIDHMRLHDINEYQCPYCLHGESEKDHLLRHLLNCHPGRPGKVLLRKQLKQQGGQGGSGTASSAGRTLSNPLSSGSVVPTLPKSPPPIAAAAAASVAPITAISSSEDQHLTSPLANTDSLQFEKDAHLQVSDNQCIKNQEKTLSEKSSPSKVTSTEIDTKVTTRSSREMQFLAIVSAAARRDSPGAAGVEGGAEGTSGVLGEGGQSSTEKIGLSGEALYRCGNEGCHHSTKTCVVLREHLQVCNVGNGSPFLCCYHCGKQCRQVSSLLDHLRVHGPKRFLCGVEGCNHKTTMLHNFKYHMKQDHQQTGYKHVPKDPNNKDPETQEFVVYPKDAIPAHVETHRKRKNEFSIEDLKRIPRPSISYVDLKCYHCTFSSKVRLNLVKHIQLHSKHPNGIPLKRYISDGKGIPIPGKQPVNPMPCLHRKEMMFDTMMNLAGSSFSESKKKKEDAMGDLRLKNPIPVEELEAIPKFISESDLHLCRIDGCNYISADAIMLKYHINTLHPDISSFPCPHCKDFTITVEKMSAHFKLHGDHLFRCGWCPYIAFKRNRVERHMKEKHVHKKLFDFILREPDDPNAPKPTEEHNNPVKDLMIFTMEGKDIVAPSPSAEPVWQCGMCKFSSVTQQEMVNHTNLKHEIKSQYKCGYCNVRSSVRASFDAHFAAKHKNKEFRVLCMYYRLDSEDIVPLGSGTGQNTHEPLWKKNDPERIRHIRGILLDDGVQEKKIWMDHTEYGTPENDEFVCPVCRSFKNTCSDTFRSHLCKEANYHRYQCGSCGITNALLPSLQRHYVKIHHSNFNKNAYINLPVEDEKEEWVENIISHQQLLIKQWRAAGGISKKDVPRSIPRVTSSSPARAATRSAVGLSMSSEDVSGSL